MTKVFLVFIKHLEPVQAASTEDYVRKLSKNIFYTMFLHFYFYFIVKYIIIKQISNNITETLYHYLCKFNTCSLCIFVSLVKSFKTIKL